MAAGARLVPAGKCDAYVDDNVIEEGFDVMARKLHEFGVNRMPPVASFGSCWGALFLGSLALAADVKPLETVAGWGQVIDPVGDCSFAHEAARFTIKVPGSVHDLWPVKGQVNAPLVLQDVEGDFTIEVLVESVTTAEEATVLPGMASTASFHSAALVIWQDAKNFARLDRTDMHNRGRPIQAWYLQVFQNGEKVVEQASPIPDKPTHLRLTRKGDRLRAAYSQDGGKSWQSVPEQKLALAAKVKAGISALNNTSRENVVQFSGLKLSQ